MNWQALIRRLQARGWTQVAIAERVGASQSAISDMLNGKARAPRFALGDALRRLDASGKGPGKRG